MSYMLCCYIAPCFNLELSILWSVEDNDLWPSYECMGGSPIHDVIPSHKDLISVVVGLKPIYVPQK